MKRKSIFVLTTGFIKQPLRKFIDTCIDESEKKSRMLKAFTGKTLVWNKTQYFNICALIDVGIVYLPCLCVL